MRWQIRTLQVPTQWGTGAFVPVPAANSTAEFNGQNKVYGAPGTVRVPSPAPPALNDGELGGPYNQPSRVGPNWFLPSIYVARVNDTMRFPGNISNSTLSPVPAGSRTTTVKAGFQNPRIGGRTVTAAIRPFTQWKTYGSK